MIKANGIREGGTIMIREPDIEVPQSFYEQANKYFRRISRMVIHVDIYYFDSLERGQVPPHNWIVSGQCNRARRSEGEVRTCAI
jgi:hypothetical protein